jgi:hypothetical protein
MLKIDRVVADPFGRKLHDAGGLALDFDLIGVLIAHPRGVVEQPHLAHDVHRVDGEIPRGGADADRSAAGDLLERVGGAHPWSP